MRLYFAGNVIAEDDSIYAFGVRHKLLTFAEKDTWAKNSFKFWIDEKPDDSQTFLDSGAFGVHTRGAILNLDEYCEYIKEHAEKLAAYAALDVIGDWRASEQNFQIMLRRGLSPLPVFHSGEPFRVLKSLVQEHKHIALGGMASDNPSRETLQAYLDRCFSIIGEFWPVQVHGFGIMSQWSLERYPFYSVDSSSAIVSAGMGQVSTFEYGSIETHDWRDYAQRTLDGGIMDHIAEDRAKKGSAHMGRRAQNIRTQLALERHVTRLWESRGIVW